MAGKRVALTLPPGSKRRATPQDTRGGWWDMSLVRFAGGMLTPIGGWKTLPGVQTNGPVRNLLSWRDLDRLRWVAAASLADIVVWDGATGTVISPDDFVAGQAAGLLDGYGIGGYGLETYGTHRSLEPEQYRAGPGDQIALDNYGETLLAMGSADGRLLQWSPELPVTTQMTPVAGAPTGRSCITTDERSVVILGAAEDPRRLDWCSLELLTDWAPTATNTAGSLQLRSTGTGLAMRRVAQGVLIWCDDDVHLLQFVGTPYVYGLQRIGSGCGPIGPEAMVGWAGRSVWMGKQSFWIYDGGVQPLPSDIDGFVFSDLNVVTAGQTFGYHNGIFPEITWHYPSAAATSPDHYVTWNYKDRLWTHGVLARSIGSEPGAFGLPLLGTVAGTVYQHETGYLADGAPRGAAVYAETGDLQIGDGDTLVQLDAIYPDLRQPQLVQFHLKGQLEAAAGETDFGVFAQERDDGVIDTLLDTRSLRLRIEGLQDGPWQLGRIRLGLTPGPGR